MVVGGGLDADEILELELFVVLLYLLDLAAVLELGGVEVLPEEVLEGEAELDVFLWEVCCQLRLSLSLLGLFEILGFLLEVAHYLLRNELSPSLILESLFDEVAENDLILSLRLVEYRILLDCGYHLWLIALNSTIILIEPTFPLLEKTLGLMSIFYEGGLLLFCEYGGLYEFFALVAEVPDENAFGTCSPQSTIVEEDIVDVLRMADVHLVRLSQE